MSRRRKLSFSANEESSNKQFLPFPDAGINNTVMTHSNKGTSINVCHLPFQQYTWTMKVVQIFKCSLNKNIFQWCKQLKRIRFSIVKPNRIFHRFNIKSNEIRRKCSMQMCIFTWFYLGVTQQISNCFLIILCVLFACAIQKQSKSGINFCPRTHKQTNKAKK